MISITIDTISVFLLVAKESKFGSQNGVVFRDIILP